MDNDYDVATRIAMMLGKRLLGAEPGEAAALGGAYAEALAMLDAEQHSAVISYMTRIRGAHDRTPQIISLADILGAKS